MHIKQVLSILNDRIQDLALNRSEHWETKIDEIKILRLIFKDRLK